MAGTWQPLAHPPNFAASTMLLLTDGTVMAQEAGGLKWWRLAPDGTGNYVNGTWSAMAPMHHTRLYYASAVLADGRVFVAGGEYSDAGPETNTAEIYDPLNDSWTVLAAPAGWAVIGDAPCCVLADGRLLLGNIEDPRTALFDPATSTWAAGPNKDDRSSEESWVLLPDGTVVTVECTNHPKAEKFVPATSTWVSAGSTPVELVEASSIEIGPGILLTDGRALFVGATSNTALYHPPAVASDPGTWGSGPTFPPIDGKPLGAKDAPACLLPNGKVLCVAGPVDGVSGDYLGPTYFFEYDAGALTRAPDPPNSTDVPYVGRMLLLPSGQVLFANGTPNVQVYTPDGNPEPRWRPRVTSVHHFLRPLGTYVLHGQQLNGLSQAVGYGDDASMATNYPLVRIRNRKTGQVVYCRTAHHSSMGVATGSAVHATHFTVPVGIDTGPAELCVVANGIASEWVRVRVLPFRPLVPLDDAFFEFLLTGLAADPPRALAPRGPIEVGPTGADDAQKARQACDQIAAGVQALQDLGRQIDAKRQDAAAAVPPAVDPDLKH